MKKSLKAIVIMVITGFWSVCMVAQNQTQFWGMAFGGQENAGVIFKTDALVTNIMVKQHFIPPAGMPYGSLVQASDGNLYGMTYSGGENNSGCLFKYVPSTGVYSIKYHFDFADGRFPEGSLIQALDGNLYGMATGGGTAETYDNGVLFKFNPQTNTYTKLVDLDGVTKGKSPYGALLQAKDGMLYGMTNMGGTYDMGVLFQFNPTNNTYAVKVNFDGSSKGQNPYGSLTQLADGKLYGVTKFGGLNECGVIFQFDPVNSTFTKVRDFEITSGGSPNGSLILATDGKLYGLAEAGGVNSQGVLFQFNPVNSTYVNKYNFDDSPNGSAPIGSLMQASDGNLYGMTNLGGTVGGPVSLGVVFQFNPVTSVYTKKLDFNGSNGSNPMFTHLIEIPVTISTSPVEVLNCVGSTIAVPYTIAGAYDAGNVFTAQLSNASGSFNTPVNIGSVTTTGAGTINAIIPPNTASGNGYRIRVVSTQPVVSGSDNGTNITINGLPDVATTVSGSTITANQSGAVYQWLNCNSALSAIPGEKNQSFTASVNGSYAVMVTLNGHGCVATSSCVNITNVGIDNAEINDQFVIYPNPANQILTISLPAKAAIELINIQGKVVKKINSETLHLNIDIGDLPCGTYLIRAKHTKGVLTRSFTKTNTD